jgi:spermidine synthase
LLVSFISGASGLIFEMVWFHRASLVFGSTVWATSLVLSSFMGGLAIGSAIVGYKGDRIRNVLRAYAGAEAVVAVSGLVLTLVLPSLTYAVVRVSRPEAESVWLTNLVRLVTAFLILLVPTTAMGTTLPLLVAALSRGRARFGSALGSVYGLNTLGAVAGVVLAETWLIATVGVAGAAWSGAFLSLAAAFLAIRATVGDGGLERAALRTEGAPAFQARVDGPDRAAPPVTRTWPLLASGFLAGAALLALEVVWFRFLTMFVLSTTLAGSLMLAVVLAGIGVGGLAASAWLSRNPHAAKHLPLVACAAGCAVVAPYVWFQSFTSGTQIGTWYGTMWMAVVLTSPASLLSGALFALMGDALQRGITVEARAAGWLTLANTLGGMCGPLIAAFVLLPTLGMERAFYVLAAAYAAIALLTVVGIGSLGTAVGPGSIGRQLRSPGLAAGGAALASALVFYPFGLMQRTYFARVAQPYGADGSSIVAVSEGPSETIFLMQQAWMGDPVYSRLVTNGFSMSGTSVAAARYMRYFVYWPMLVHRGPIKRVLVVCYGVGVTAGAALDLPSVETIDVAEISSEVVAASDIIYPSNHPLRDPRVRLHLEDGRQFLESTTQRFDLITGEPPPPRTPGAVNIYSREYFQLIRDRLADGGMATYWLPVARPDPGTNVSSIIRAFCDVFDDCSLWNATPFDLMLVGTRNVRRPIVDDDFTMSWALGDLRSRLTEIGLELPQQVGATFIGDASYLRELVGGAPPLVDNSPQRLSPVPGRPSLSDPGYGTDPAVTKLYQAALDPARARQAFLTSPFIRGLWSQRLIDGTLPYFEHQAIMNRVLWDGGRPLQQIESLHWLLTETPLRTLPLWILGSDHVKAAIARRRDDGTGASEYARGLSALAQRDYAAAAIYFGRAEERGLKGDQVRPLRVYALCLAWRLDQASVLVQGIRPSSAEQQHFWEWLKKKFGVGPT